jgi:glycine oxidase
LFIRGRGVVNVVIIGAGVAGLGIGWRLLQAGCQVTILERTQPATGASWAAAGMLAVTAELEEATEAERGLALRSHALWPGFAAELEAASGRRVFLSRVGALPAGPRHGRAGSDAGARKGDIRVPGPRPGADLVPLLGTATVGGLWSPHEAHVDNRALGEALTIAFSRRAGCSTPMKRLVTIEAGPFGAHALSSSTGRCGGGGGGAWSSWLEDIPFQPVKGEVIALAPGRARSCRYRWCGARGVYCCAASASGRGRLLVDRRDGAGGRLRHQADTGKAATSYGRRPAS